MIQGGQFLPRCISSTTVATIIPTVYYTQDETRKILQRCKQEGVSFAHAVFALVNMGWIRMRGQLGKPEEPMYVFSYHWTGRWLTNFRMLYSALSLRSSLNALPSKPPLPSYFHLALGYYNIVMPSFIPPSSSPSQIFWYRAHKVKQQTLAAVKSRFLIGKSLTEMQERLERAVEWAIIDDVASSLSISKQRSVKPTPTTTTQVLKAKVSDAPLLGISILGNLDMIYSHEVYVPFISLESITTGSRQRRGGVLLFAFIFKGRMCLSLGYDNNGFEEGVLPTLWQEIGNGVREFLLKRTPI